jgi:hypothetical protein
LNGTYDNDPVCIEAKAARSILESFGNLHSGGVWIPSYGGSEHSYQWIHRGRFLRYTTRDENSLTGIIGVDPATGQVAWWCFYEQGGVSTAVMTQDGPAEWTVRIKGAGPTIRLLGDVVDGDVKLTIRVWKKGEDETESKALELIVDGKKLELPGQSVNWKRRNAGR